MEQDQRLASLPSGGELKTSTHDYPATYPAYYDDEVSEGRRSLQQYFAIVYKRLPIIIALTLLVTTAVAFYMYRQPSVYQATTEMIIEPRKPKVQSRETININFGNDINYYNTQLKLLESTDLMKEVVLRLGLHRDPNLMEGGRSGVLAGLRSMFSSDKKAAGSDSALPVLAEVPSPTTSAETIQLTPEEKHRVEYYASILASSVTAEPTEQTNLVNISVRHTNPQIAARV